MRCLITGGTGFIGRAAVSHMRALGWDVDVISTTAGPGVLPANLADGPPPLPHRRYHAVFHIAGRAHVVSRTRADEKLFFSINTEGTKNLLAALERQEDLPDAFVLVSTVAVYGRVGGELLNEDTPREATDAYGLSKRRSEDAVLEWGESNRIRVGVVRLPLVTGAGAPGNLRAMIGAMRRRRYAGIGDGAARRSVVDVGDVVRALEKVAAAGGIYHLTDGYHPSFSEIEAAIAHALDRPLPHRIPVTVAKLAAVAGDVIERTGVRPPLTTRTLEKMTTTLTFDDSRARKCLGWAPTPALRNARTWVLGIDQMSALRNE